MAAVPALNGAQQSGMSEAIAGVGENQYLTFILAGEEYGVDILRVQEIRGWSKVTPIPNTPDYIKGVINLRGTIVPIVDLRSRFALPACEYGPTTVVIVLRVCGQDRQRIMGVIVDAVSDVYDVRAEDLKPAPELEGLQSSALLGLATVDKKMVIVLDVDRLLNGAEAQLDVASDAK